jgi:hypothetical protein
MAELRQLWVTLTTGDVEGAGTEADLYLEFALRGLSIKLPDQVGDDLERPSSQTPPLTGSSNATSYIFHVSNLATADFVPGTVSLRNGNQSPVPGDLGRFSQGWRCHAVLVIGLGEDGRFYPLVAMSNVDRWLAADQPEGLVLSLDVLKPSEVGVLEGVHLVLGGS